MPEAVISTPSITHRIHILPSTSASETTCGNRRRSLHHGTSRKNQRHCLDDFRRKTTSPTIWIVMPRKEHHQEHQNGGKLAAVTKMRSLKTGWWSLPPLLHQRSHSLKVRRGIACQPPPPQD